jgi:lipoprotein-anchoring transpeptidase ErfK/SrfK
MSVDGDVGAVTRRGLCAARVALGLSVSRDEMQPGSDEERILMATSSLPVPGDAPGTNRWILIDETCQVLFAGEGGGTIKYVFPTSTGQDEFPTRNGRGWRVFRYDPAVANGGWHDSSDYPASGDNPLNGNMYKPLYFDGGQAIHGANNVATSPQSHGCARVRPGHQDLIVNWIGLSDVTRELWDPGDIGLSVTVQGQY